jgi:hypothetical protein
MPQQTTSDRVAPRGTCATSSAGQRCRRPQVVASDDEQVQVPAYGRQRLGADAAQVTSGSLIGDGTDLLGHGERDLPQPGELIRGNPYVMVKSAIAAGERHREEQSGDHGVPVV